MRQTKRVLTKKQEDFAQAIVSGLGRLDAYKRSHDPKTSNINTLYSMSFKVVSNERVKARIAELRAQSSESLLWSREMAIRKLTEILEAEDSSRDIQLKAIKELNNMSGYEGPRRNAAQGQRIAVMGDLIIDTGVRRDQGVTIEGEAMKNVTDQSKKEDE